MVRVRRTMLFSQAQVWVVVVVLSGVAALAQEPNPAADVPGAQNGPPPIINAAQVPITVLEDTLIRVQTNEPINSKRAKHGTPVLFTLSEDVVVNDVLAIPRGAMLRGAVIESKKAGVLTGSPELALQLTSLVLCGRSYPLDTYQFKVKGTSKTKPTETKALRGAYVGAIVGALTGSVGGKGGVVDDGSGRVASMTAGAVVGAGVGTLASAATPGPGIWIPSEAQVDFYLAAPVTITPVSAKEAARLAQGLHRGGPTLYVRDTP